MNFDIWIQDSTVLQYIFLEAMMLTKKAIEIEIIFESNTMISNDASIVMMFSVEEMFFFSTDLTVFRWMKWIIFFNFSDLDSFSLMNFSIFEFDFQLTDLILSIR